MMEQGGRVIDYKVEFMRKDGSTIPILLTGHTRHDQQGNLSAAIVSDASGKEIASVGSFVDLRNRLEMERALRYTQEQILQSELAGGLGLVNASNNQLRQVFLNMVANARDAMINGGTLAVVTGSDGDQVVIEIIDTGTGIREEHIDKIFDSFFTTKSEVKGVGLGLSVCYGFIQDHGGVIEVKSKRAVGTTFTIRRPVQGPRVDDENAPIS